MKVLFVSGYFPPALGGVGDYTHELYQEMKRRIGRENVCVITEACVGRRDDDPHVLSLFERWNLRGMRIALSAIRAVRPDAVHIQYPSYPPNSRAGSLYITLLPILLRILHRRASVFCTIHEFSNKTLKGKVRLLVSMIFCHGIVVVDESYRKEIVRFCPFLARRITYLPIGSNIADHRTTLAHTREIRGKLGWAENDPILGYFGILREGKGLDDLIDAFASARRAISNLRLLLIGGIDSAFDEHALQDRLRTAGAAESVTITGRVSEKEASQYLATANVCVLPYEDGVSTKRGGFIAAVVHGQAIVTTRPTDKMEGLHNKENVLLVSPGDVPELARTIRMVVNDRGLRERLRKNVADLKHLYSWETIAEKHSELYQHSRKGVRKRAVASDRRTNKT